MAAKAVLVLPTVPVRAFGATAENTEVVAGAGEYTRMQPFASTAPIDEHSPLVAALLVGTKSLLKTGSAAFEWAFDKVPENMRCTEKSAALMAKTASPPGACLHAAM